MQTPDSLLYGSAVARPGTLSGIHVREDLLFTDHRGQDSRSIRKHAEKALAQLADPLSRCLAADERVLYVARMQAPATWMEKYTLGLMIYGLTMVHAVVTNQRVLFFLVKSNGKWKRSLRALPWSAVTAVSVRGWLNRNLELTCRNGAKEKYWRLRTRDAKKLKALLPHLLDAHRGSVGATEHSHAHCPECFAALAPAVYECRQCGLIFKNEGTMKELALLIPGGGYFYTGNYGLAVLDFIAEAYLLLLLLVIVLAGLGDPSAAEAGEAIDPAGVALGAGIVLVILVLEKLMTIHHCKRFVRDYLPTQQRTGVAAAAAGGR